MHFFIMNMSLIYLTQIDSSIIWYPLWQYHKVEFQNIQQQVKYSEVTDTCVSEDITISTVHDDLQSIIDTGIGYPDAVGYIAFPLIIALFAFSFTFLFSAINDINKRYESKHISRLFEKSLSYRGFMWMSRVSALYIVAFAGLSLSKNPELSSFLHSCGSVISVTIAGLYATAVLCFVRKCIAYNKPAHLIAEINIAHKWDQMRIPVQLFFQRCKDWFSGLFHGKGYKEFRGWGYRLSESGFAYSTDSIFIAQLADLTKYALDSKDTNLVYSIFKTLDAVIAKEKESNDEGRYRKKTIIEWAGTHRLTFQYYEQILESSNPQWDEQVEEFLVWRLLDAFSKSKYMNPVDIYFLFKYLQKLVTCDRVGLISKYIDRSKYYFSFLLDLSNVAYVVGATEGELEDVKSDGYDNWCELRDYHFLVAAYWIAEGKYSLLPELLLDQSYRSVYLYPVHAEDILYRYQQCKKRLSKDGCFFDNKTANDLFGKKIDLNAILDRYAAILLLLCHEGERLTKQGATEDDLKEIVNAKICIGKYVSSLTTNPKLRCLSPDIHNVDFDKIFANGLKRLTDFYPKEKPKWWCFVRKKYDPFALPLDKDAKSQMDNLFETVLQHKLSYMQGFWREAVAGDEGCITINPFKTHVVKDVLIQQTAEIKNGFSAVSHRLDVVEGRLMYLFLDCLDSMVVKHKRIKNHNLKDFITEYLKGREKEYLLLDVGDHNSVLLEPRYEGYVQYFNNETLYKSLEGAKYSLLTDLPLYMKYEHSVMLIPINVLPTITRNQLNITYKDVSSKKEGRYTVELTVDPCIEICFSPKAEILCLTPER